MASITIRNLDDDIRTRLRVRAAGNGHSMEEEVRRILRRAVGRERRSRDLTSIIRSYFGPESAHSGDADHRFRQADRGFQAMPITLE